MIIRVYNSYILGYVFVCLYGLSAGLVWYLPLTFPPQILLSALVLIGGSQALRSQGFGASGNSIRFNSKNQIEVKSAGDSQWYGCQVTNSVVWGWLIIARVKIEGRHLSRRLLICADAIRPSEFRYLCAWLKYGH
jgi:Membrane-bound toxin component of toxin-antitoxin system